MNVRSREIIAAVSWAFCSPSGSCRSRASSSEVFCAAACLPRSARRSASPTWAFWRFESKSGTNAVGDSAQRGRHRSISPTQRAPYLAKNPESAAWAWGPPSKVSRPRQNRSSVVVCRCWTTSGKGRITSATSISARPISVVTLLGADKLRVSAALGSPSQANRFWLSQAEAANPAMSTAFRWGSSNDRLSRATSSRINSTSAAPDLPSTLC